MSEPAPPLEIAGSIARQVEPQVPPDWPPSGLGPVRPIAEQLPAPSELPADTWLAVSAGEPRAPGLLSRLLARRAPPRAHLAVCCTALLTRGYANVCAADGVAFGRTTSL